MEFYQRIRELREDTEPHLKQEEIGILLGMTQKKISRLETNKTQPTTEEIKKYCIYYNLSADYILGLINDKKALK